MLVLVVTLLALPASAPRAIAEVRLPSVRALHEALRTGGEVELEREARRLGATRLVRLAGSGPRADRLVALRALPLVEDAWGAAPDLVALLVDPDREVVTAAARALRRLGDGLTPEGAFGDDLPGDLLPQTERALLDAARRRAIPVETRAGAIAAAGAIRRALAATDPDAAFSALLSDDEPAVRRAAVEALDGRRDAALLGRALDDRDSSVLAAAAGPLCAEAPGSIPEEARARLRTLAADEHAAVADRADVVPCLRAFATAGDRALLKRLGSSKSELLRRRARRDQKR